jgi:hypothetical protein
MDGIMELNGDQVAAKQCILATIKYKGSTKEEHTRVL